MKRLFFSLALFAASLLMFSCNDQAADPSPEETAAKTVEPKYAIESVTYKDDTTTLQGSIAYDANDSAKRPAVLVVPEWWGVVDFTKSRAAELVKLGYISMTVDMYGNGKVVENPKDANATAMPFYTNPQMAKKRLEAAINEIKKHPRADASRVGAIGFCFGGSMVLNAVKMGEDLKAVVSFHGGLEGVRPEKDKLKSKILVCHGGDDSFVPQSQVDAFKKQMDSVGARYEFIVYPGATHAFTNPGADEKAKKFNMPIAYNPAADSASWQDMKRFFEINLK